MEALCQLAIYIEGLNTKRGVISTEEIIFGYLRQPRRQATLYDTFPSYDRVTSVSLSLTAVNP